MGAGAPREARVVDGSGHGGGDANAPWSELVGQGYEASAGGNEFKEPRGRPASRTTDMQRCGEVSEAVVLWERASPIKASGEKQE